jgi:hypothetical protein
MNSLSASDTIAFKRADSPFFYADANFFRTQQITPEMR